MKKNGFARYQSAPGFAPILILIIIAILGVGFYFLKQNKSTPISVPSPSLVPIVTADPTTDWKTYQGSLFHFKYPSDWTLTSLKGKIYLSSPQTQKGQKTRKEDASSDEFPSDIFIVEKQDISSKYNSLEQWINDTQNFTNPETIKKITLGGVEAYQFEQGGMNNWTIIIFPLKNSYYEIGFADYTNPNDPNVVKKINIISQFLSSFQFTK